MTLSLSIVTPSYNQGRYIDRTLRSVLDQGVAREYWVIDGGSRDETVDILRRYDKRLQWVSEPDRGQAHAVNKGFARMQGDVIGWLNSDDVFFPGSFQAVLEYFQAHPEADVLYGEAQHINENDQVIEPYPVEPWDLERLKVVCFLCQPAVFFRKRVIEKYGPLDENLRYCMDYEFWLRLALRGAVFHRTPQRLAGSRLYAQTKTLGDRLKVHAEINSMLRDRLGRVPDRWLANYAHAFWDGKGLARAHRWFPIMVASMTLWSSLRWNHGVSRSLIKTMREWLTRV